MNVIDLKILTSIIIHNEKNQRKLSKINNYSLGKINESMKNLLLQGYLDDNYEITEKTKKLVTASKVNNAIILAAGVGMRMIPFNETLSKGLISIDNVPLVERIIHQLHDKKITDITIVVGYMMESYDYLIDKYEVKLVVNQKYSRTNSLVSLNTCSNLIDNTYVIPCDLWFEQNPFNDFELTSWYLIENELTDESNLRCSKTLSLFETKEFEFGNKMVGLAYIGTDIANEVKLHITEYLHEDNKNQWCYWEDSLIVKKKFLLPAKYNVNKVIEINKYEDIYQFNEENLTLKSPILEDISKKLNCKVEDISDLTLTKKGMTNRSFSFVLGKQKYIMRLSGEGTNLLINRANEKITYELIKDLHISDEIIVFDLNKGYKLTKFINNVHNCDVNNFNEVERCMKVLRFFHNKKLKSNYIFDLFERIEYYEELWGDNLSTYDDYSEVKAKIYRLKDFIDKLNPNYSLCHIDAVSDNFLFSDDGIKLIDWEYAAMQDPHVDIAMFAIYAIYDFNQINKLIDLYFEGQCDETTKTKIYAYIAICGLVWSNWCEYKKTLGVEFGQYTLAQYRYAKDYYKKVSERLKWE